MQVSNDYCQYYVDTGERPQNFIRDAGLEERYAEVRPAIEPHARRGRREPARAQYPRFQHLINLKRALVGERATPPMYLKARIASMRPGLAMLLTRPRAG